MQILGIETSCDETALCLVEVRCSKDGVPSFIIKKNLISSQIKIHEKYGGIVPEIAARAHLEKIIPILKEFGQKQGKKKNQNLSQIDLITVTHGPGLITSLLVGLEVAKTLSFHLQKPLIPVNHLAGHLAAHWAEIKSKGNKEIKEKDKDEKKIKKRKIFPLLGLIVSGGHTQLVLSSQTGKYRLIGSTRDDAAGECLDKIAKLLDLGYPGGPIISKLAKKSSEFTFNLPSPMINSKDFDFSFSGLKTAVFYLLKKTPVKTRKSPAFIKGLCFAVQQAMIDVLIKKTLKAGQKYQVKTIVLGGGVTANKELRKQIQEKINKINQNKEKNKDNLNKSKNKKDINKIELLIAPRSLATDNAVMIAIAGYFQYQEMNSAQRKDLKNNWRKIKADPNLIL